MAVPRLNDPLTVFVLLIRSDGKSHGKDMQTP
jgi:hypothetical protein